MKNSTLLTFSFFLLPFVAARAATVQPVALPPFTFAGRIVDYAHVAYDAESSVEVRAKAADGTLLAKTTTSTYGTSAYNYVLNIPLASQTIAGHVKTGDTVTFEFVDTDGTVYSGLVAAGDATIGKVGDYHRVDVILASDADGDGVADEYVETLSYQMWRHGIETYDPNADYDGDGKSNYAEYLAGTNPFDATDRFDVKAMSAETDGYFAFRFQVSQGRYYTVDTTEELGTPTWETAPFSVADPSAALQTKISTGGSETGYRIIYVKKGTDPSRFWKLRVE